MQPWYDGQFPCLPCTTVSTSCPISSSPATRRAPSASSSRVSIAGDPIRCCSASPVRARRSRWRNVIAAREPADAGHGRTTRRWRRSSTRNSSDSFPSNAVEYFVSYYDYYQPEAYVPATDSYIEKEATINDEIDRMRLSATRSLFERRDVIIVASVSCIYGLGSPEAYYGMLLPLECGQRIDRDQVLRKLVEIQYERNDHDFGRGTFRVRGDIVEVYPVVRRARAADRAIRRRSRRLGVVRPSDRKDASPA